MKNIWYKLSWSEKQFDLASVPLSTTSLYLTHYDDTQDVELIPPKEPLPNLRLLDLSNLNPGRELDLENWVLMLPELRTLRTTAYISNCADFNQLQVLKCDFLMSRGISFEFPPNLIDLTWFCEFEDCKNDMFPKSLLRLKMCCLNAPDDFSKFPTKLLPRGLKLLNLPNVCCWLQTLQRGWLPFTLEVFKVRHCIGTIADASVFPTETLHTLHTNVPFRSQTVLDKFANLSTLSCDFRTLSTSMNFPKVHSLIIQYETDYPSRERPANLQFLRWLFPNLVYLKFISHESGILRFVQSNTAIFEKIQTLEMQCRQVGNWSFASFPALENLSCYQNVTCFQDDTQIDCTFIALLLRSKAQVQTLTVWPNTNVLLQQRVFCDLEELTQRSYFRTLTTRREQTLALSIREFWPHVSFLKSSDKDATEFWFNS